MHISTYGAACCLFPLEATLAFPHWQETEKDDEMEDSKAESEKDEGSEEKEEGEGRARIVLRSRSRQ